MSPYLIIGTVVWLYLLSVVKRSKLPAYSFIIGSVGLFFLLIAVSRPYWVWFFTQAVIKGVSIFGSIGDMSQAFAEYSIIQINHIALPVTLSVDYECSGVIEASAYIGLLVFFPFYSRQEKVFYGLVGLFWIYAVNILRLFLVILMVHFGGNSWFFMAHAVVGRIVFYVLVIILYYNIFTHSQISKGIYAKVMGRRKESY